MTAEDQLQISVANYLRLQYPHILFCHVGNGGSRNVIEGAKLKRMGVRPGMPDLMIFDGFYSTPNQCAGVAIELKIGKNKQTESQIEVQKKLEQEGWRYHLCYDFDSAKGVIDKYLS